MGECSGTDHRFVSQRIAMDTWERATTANMLADYAAGFQQEVLTFISTRPEFSEVARILRTSSASELAATAEQRKSHSLGFLVMMMTGQCNADCTICFTDRRAKRGELEPDARDEVLRQASALGAQYVYVPGEGEPTIDRGFWQFLDTCKQLDLHAIVFTNGLILSDESVCQRYWGMSIADGIARLAEHPVSFYVKHWSRRPELVGEMMQIDPARYHFTEWQGEPVHLGLYHLLKSFPRDRLGLEIVVERRNADEVVEELVPFAERHGLARIVEMIQHNGRTFGDGGFDPSPRQVEAVEPLLSPTSCHLATCKAVVTSRGYLSPRIAILENQLPEDRRNVRNQDLYHLLHHTDYVVEKRYILSCLCEEIPAKLAQAQNLVGPRSIVPKSLRILS